MIAGTGVCAVFLTLLLHYHSSCSQQYQYGCSITYILLGKLGKNVKVALLHLINLVNKISEMKNLFGG